MPYFQKIFLFLLLIVSSNHSIAAPGDSTRRKFPRILLLQLSAEQNRIAALAKTNNQKRLEEVTNDAYHVRKVMINDFRDHFDFCPVYYFIDTNADAIRNKHFDGILLNADGSEATNLELNSNSNDYLIAFYGFPVEKGTNDHGANTASSLPGRGIVLLNSQYKQVGYFIEGDYTSIGVAANGQKDNYSYMSDHYNIQYLPYAKQLNEALYRRTKHIQGLRRSKRK